MPIYKIYVADDDENLESLGEVDAADSAEALEGFLDAATEQGVEVDYEAGFEVIEESSIEHEGQGTA